ncbi:hypothetical protein AARAC_010284 [Aspergillus arachidicola]|uniref:F-box domain protein n=1 Tax=Aspergillus arachidicola TaxID=656916 RepID=A0A2G7G2H5_9EURO|nr:hypothetical protein AARAC_010284 [Aspergillus arachidicola]
MTFALAGDILYIILEILGDQSDYNSLYQCGITSRCFTEPALQVLYRRRNSSPLSWGQFISRRTCMSLAGTDDVAEAAIRKWAAMWRSITLSTLEHTYLPYYSYIRYLDLEGLRELRRELYISGEKGGFKDADSEKFLNELQPNTLESFDLICYSGLGPRMIRGLGSHWNSLTELKLGYLGITATEKLLSLTAPPALKVLLRRFMDDALLLAQILPEKSLRLSSLSLADYSIQNANLFHEAVHHQQSLQHLCLNGIGSDQPEHNEPLGRFHRRRCNALTPFLPHLEKLLTGGKYFRDDVWNAFLRLPKLKYLMILGRSEFSAKGILDFIDQLGPGNSGFSLSILDPTSDTDIDYTTAHYIRDVLISKFDGRFDFPTVSEAESVNEMSE